MQGIRVIRIGQVPFQTLADLCTDLARVLRVPCSVAPEPLDAAFALHPERRQLHSTAILARLSEFEAHDGQTRLAVADVDLYIPILMFVFGEAQLRNGCAVISTCRLRQEFYGLPADPRLLRERLRKEALHELGHTFGLSHCDDYLCAMAPSHAVEWIDLKQDRFCETCRSTISHPCVPTLPGARPV